MQLGALDRAAALKRTGVLMDVSFGQGVRVRCGDRFFAAPLDMAGVCVGEGTTVGAGVSIAAGRAIPAGLKIAPSPQNLVVRVPEEIDGLVAVHDGTLRRL